ncbi:DUF305 domain-containing protein [Shimwellia pseudoproteus]|uniref:CopM family metallochaperone n=1 Tax=Shimwellia pseudoproteus TaxID=570012 RepID=UPI0018EB90B0|nr:DUF305 domain-containing protein [Shimwellia pseudoproteus]MBJ3816712.1 DUF305 domain-containing protein [Shimwellia pseudoproteus]
MKITQLILTLALATPLASFAQEMAAHDHQSPSPASQEYMAGMDKMHQDMMAGMQESDPDKAFAKGMIAHHQGAIAMAETELKYGKDPEMRKLASDIIRAQKGEIAQMQHWLQK